MIYIKFRNFYRHPRPLLYIYASESHPLVQYQAMKVMTSTLNTGFHCLFEYFISLLLTVRILDIFPEVIGMVSEILWNKNVMKAKYCFNDTDAPSVY